ncbi:MAG: hypothetical protein KKB74_06345 [Bacteroidetes bacterium]|nr:hypothetical protein [Bacteroidota bacterium]
MAVTILITGTILTLLILYFFVFRPMHLHWGATNEEVKAKMPGDGIVKTVHFNATRAISINSTPENIWKWIIQIGSKRAGWYSIDLIDNGGIESSKEILPEFQKIENGYFVPFTPDQKNGMWVKEYKEPEYILWVDKEGNATWLWYLKKKSETETRLITRLRTKYNFLSIWIIYYALYDFGDIIMMKKCMKGIKERAEK